MESSFCLRFVVRVVLCGSVLIRFVFVGHFESGS